MCATNAKGPIQHSRVNQMQNNLKNLPTPIKLDRLKILLKNHHNRDFIINGFENGFKIDFKGEQQDTHAPNSASTLENPHIVQKKIDSEIELGRIAGPFDTPPFTNFRISPLAMREKQEPGKFRLLHNLSFPYNELSVNYNIPKTSTKVQYASIADAIQMIHNHSPKAFLAKADIREAFRLIPLNPEQYNLTGFKWANKFYYDKCLPQGLASSCQIFEQFSDVLQHILSETTRMDSSVKVLDDFLMVANSAVDCNKLLNGFLSLCEDLGVPIADNKTCRPTNELTFLGIQLNTIKMIASLPIEKIIKYGASVKQFLTKNWITKTELKSLLGTLQYATSVVRGGRPFLRRMYDLLPLAGKRRLVQLNQNAKEDLQMWSIFLDHFNGISIISNLHSVNSPLLNIYTDASKTAFAGTFGTNWIQESWPISWQQMDIIILELYPIYVLITMFAFKIRNTNIIFHCDNQALCYVLNKQTTKHELLLPLLRKLVLLLLENNITFQALHIPGKKNKLCDFLSRSQDSTRLLDLYGMKPVKSEIPEALLPGNFDLRSTAYFKHHYHQQP